MPSLWPVVPWPLALRLLGPGEPPVPLSVVPFESVEPPPEPVAPAPPEDEAPPEPPPPPELCAMESDMVPRRIVTTKKRTLIFHPFHMPVRRSRLLPRTVPICGERSMLRRGKRPARSVTAPSSSPRAAGQPIAPRTGAASAPPEQKLLASRNPAAGLKSAPCRPGRPSARRLPSLPRLASCPCACSIQ